MLLRTRRLKLLTRFCILQSSLVRDSPTRPILSATNLFQRVPVLLLCCTRLCCGYDIQSRTKIREEKSLGLHLHLLNSWRCISHVGQSIWNCLETYHGGKQPIHTPFDLRLHHLNHSLHFDADELLEQSFEPVPNIHVSYTKSQLRKPTKSYTE